MFATWWVSITLEKPPVMAHNMPLHFQSVIAMYREMSCMMIMVTFSSRFSHIIISSCFFIVPLLCCIAIHVLYTHEYDMWSHILDQSIFITYAFRKNMYGIRIMKNDLFSFLFKGKDNEK